MEKLIFVVDDEEDIRELISENLKRYGFKVKEFPDGSTLLKELPKLKPDLIIMDIMMPEINGLEACSIIKKNSETSNIPIILSTVKGQIKDIESGFKSGADAYIVKPFSPSKLIEKVHIIFDKVERRKKAIEEKNIHFDKKNNFENRK